MDAIEKGEVPFVRVSIPLIFGILSGYAFASSHIIFTLSEVSLFIFFALLILFIVFYRRCRFFNKRWLGGALVFMTVLCAAYIRTVCLTGKLDEGHFSRSRQNFLIITGNSEPKIKGGLLRFEATVTNSILDQKVSSARGKLLVAIKLEGEAAPRIAYGTQLLVPGNYTSVKPPLNPSEFDYREYLAKQGIYHQLYLEERQAVILQEGGGNRLMTLAIEARKKLVGRFSRCIRNKEAAAVASTLILGYRSDLSEEIVRAYSSTGTMHVLSVSGMHVGIIFFILAFLLRGLDRSNRLRIVKAIVIILLIFVYALLTGLSAAACRAALMISFLILGKALNRNSNSYNLLAISAVILLLYNPLFLLDLGFQLSYMAVLGLIYLYPKIYSSYYVGNRVLDKIWSYSALSTSAQLATFPISMFYFHQFPLYFLLSNLIIVLPVALIMYMGMLLMLMPFEFLSQPLSWILEQFILFTNFLLIEIEDLPGSTISGVWLKSWEVVLLYLLGVLSLIKYSNKIGIIWRLRMSMLIVFLLLSGRSLDRILLDRNRRIIIYSLRKDIAIGLLEGRQAHVITNLRENDKSFLYSIKPYLEERRIERVNTIAYKSNVETKTVLVHEKFIQFRNWKGFIWDEQAPSATPDPLEVHTVIVRNNSIPNVETVGKAMKCRQIVFDGSNSDSNIRRWVVEAERLHLQYHVLKRSSSLLLNL